MCGRAIGGGNQKPGVNDVVGTRRWMTSSGCRATAAATEVIEIVRQVVADQTGVSCDYAQK